MDNNDTLSLFAVEGEELTADLDGLLLTAESAGALSAETVNELFRLVHTLKGSAAMAGCAALAETAHSAENILQRLRANPAASIEALSPALAVLLDFTAFFRDAAAAAVSGEAAPEGSALNERLRAVCAALSGDAPDDNSQAPAEKPAAAQERPRELSRFARFRVFLQAGCPMAALRGFLILRAANGVCAESYSVPDELQARPELDAQIAAEGFELGFVPKEGQTPESVLALLKKQPFVERIELIALPQAAKAAAARSAARVSVSQERVNALIDLMNELLAAETALEQRLRGAGALDSGTEKLLRTVSHHGSAVQSMLNELGMTELSGVFLRMQRLARDQLKQAGRQADIITEGAELSVDKSMTEAIGEMLQHIVRNAVDHGLESPEERLAASKPARGTLRLTAERVNGRLRLAVSDDGRGISSEKVLRAAEQRGLLTKPVAAYSRREIFDFLLLSGFTTKKTVTQSSGRGVGMDAVQSMVKKLGGRIQISSTESRGTDVLLDLPLSLTMVDVLRLSLAGATCYIPANVVEKVVAPQSVSQLDNGTIRCDNAEYRPLLPSVRGDALLLLKTERERLYLACESIGEPEATLARPLPATLNRLLADANPYYGCIQDSLGGMYLIIDVHKVARRAGVVV